MKHTLNNENSEVVISLSVSKDDLASLVDKNIEKAAKKVKINGYRPGKAPLAKAIQYVDKEDCYRRALGQISEKEFPNVAKYIEENKLTVAELVSVSENVLENGDLSLEYKYSIFPDFSVVDFKSLDVKVQSIEVTEEEIKEYKNKLLDSLSVYVDAKEGQTTANGDKLVIDFKGFIDNEPFEGGEAEGYELQLGSHSFIKGFEEQLLDKPLGWSGSINVTFPEDYFSEAFQGKEAVFDVTIHSFTKLQTFEVTEENVKLFGLNNVSSVEEFDKWISNKVKLERLFDVCMKFKSDLSDEIFSKYSIHIHPNFLSNTINKLKNDFKATLTQYKIKKTEYLKLIKMSEEDLEKQFTKEALKIVSHQLVEVFLAQKIEFKPTKEELEALADKLAEKNLSTGNAMLDNLAFLQFMTKVVALVSEEKSQELTKAFDALLQ
ncbi:trigger factor [Mycoplasma sp. NEAQ87857]|uniref:trigger factor n=1 Tax=Mycoplasma sp. NEAQ87857 TaxID=2683967 RepID=UPI001318E2FB|nr:trigger factor [Mycoplasma sp. NEAQ87857]QGZ97950.1 trigger factor [Mycoplasma sp. NEAQ87857]